MKSLLNLFGISPVVGLCQCLSRWLAGGNDCRPTVKSSGTQHVLQGKFFGGVWKPSWHCETFGDVSTGAVRTSYCVWYCGCRLCAGSAHCEDKLLLHLDKTVVLYFLLQANGCDGFRSGRLRSGSLPVPHPCSLCPEVERRLLMGLICWTGSEKPGTRSSLLH